MTFIRFIAISVIVVMLISSGVAQPWREKGDERAIILYHFGDEQNVAALQGEIARALPPLESKLAVKLPFPARIYLASSDDEFNRITGHSLPAWSQGVSFPENGSIILKSPRFSKDVGVLHQTAVHELVHLLISLKAGSSVPRWLNEGIALMLSGEGAGKPLLPLSRALWGGKVIPLHEIEQVDLMTHEQAQLAYLESYHAAQFLVQQFDWERLNETLAAMKQGTPWEEALFARTSLDGAGFEAEWRRYLEDSYRWMFLLNAQNMIYFSFVALVIVAYIAMRRRRRRTLRKWQAEEASQQGILQ
jgi:hypothetical protein